MKVCPPPPTFCGASRCLELRQPVRLLCNLQGENESISDEQGRSLRQHPGALCTQHRKHKSCFCRSFMELAGLEPATSWVRSSRPRGEEPANLQRLFDERLARRNISRNTPCTRFGRAATADVVYRHTAQNESALF